MFSRFKTTNNVVNEKKNNIKLATETANHIGVGALSSPHWVLSEPPQLPMSTVNRAMSNVTNTSNMWP